MTRITRLASCTCKTNVACRMDTAVIVLECIVGRGVASGNLMKVLRIEA